MIRASFIASWRRRSVLVAVLNSVDRRRSVYYHVRFCEREENFVRMDATLFKGALGAAAVVAALLVFGFDAAAQGAKKASPCKGLDEKACKAKAAECRWIVPSKGKQKPYCRLAPRRTK